MNWTRRPITPRGNTLIRMANELMDPYTQTWDTQLVNDIFWGPDAAKILAIPVKEDMEDFWAWHPDPKGCFSVKSAYRLSRQLEMVRSGQLGQANQDHGFKWESIWRTPCPPNVHQFLWRIAHNTLPVYTNLKRKGIEIDTLCPICQRRDEDGSHILFQCKSVKKIWREMSLQHCREKCASLHDPKDTLEELLQGDIEKKARCIAILWSWWTARNKFLKEGRPIAVNQILWQIKRTAWEYKEFFGTEKMSTTVRSYTWRKPSLDVLKINTDGSYNKESNVGGWGFVIRDADGDVVGSGAGQINHAQDALHTKAEACLKALEAAQEWGISRVVLETDAMQLVHAIKSSDSDLAPNGVLFREIKTFAFLHFSSFSIVHCPRAYNNVANALALFGSKMVHQPQAIWPGDVPTFARLFVAADLARQVV